MAPRFVDRDMFMRFLGGGVGHKTQGCPTNLNAHGDMPPEADSDEEGKDEDDLGEGDDKDVGNLGSQDQLEGNEDEESEDDGRSEHDSVEDDGIQNSDWEGNAFFDPEDGEGAGEDFLEMEGYGEL
jgi:hypothetical protein